MKQKEIWVVERGGEARVAEPVTVSVPLAKGEFPRGGGARLLDPLGRTCPVQMQALSRWPDGSVKWLLCDFAASAPARGREVYRLLLAPEPQPLPAGIEVGCGREGWRVETGAASFLLAPGKLLPFVSAVARGQERVAADGGLLLTLLNGERSPAMVEEVALETRGALRTTLRLSGAFAGEVTALFACRVSFYAGRSCVCIDLTVRNPLAAQHPGGLWDLGDPGSLVFRDLSWHFPFSAEASALSLTAEPGGEPFRGEPATGISIRQLSSGGRIRLSPNHRAADGRCYASDQGYLVQSGDRLLHEGDRATPLLWCGRDGTGILAVLPRFWQEFPKELGASSRAVDVSLFPCSSVLHELQGGEQKTTTFIVDFAALPGGDPWFWSPLCAVASPEQCRAAGVLADLPPLPSEGEDLVDRFISSPEELLVRREEIDEYGWRHFGDVYADHEAVYHKGAEPFISHYNNQYDLCAGLYRKFLSSGDPRWQELAADLARHVFDIDIYHTDRDREEYNGGLFWHTEHYIPAALATHRTFSRNHLEQRDPSRYGGGPGSEHCYTSGLLLHYFLTGNPEFRDAVVALADWSYRSLTGGTVLAALKRSGAYCRSLRGIGTSPRLFPRYPFTRATGNVVNAALDAYRATDDQKYLRRAEGLIQDSFHPLDEIGARGLLEPEKAWSYTVFLCAVAKYLELKRELDEYDGSYAYARDALLAYAGWMAENEYPYLQAPEKLEYPNETWAAQELRKVVVLHHASGYAQGEVRERLLRKGKELLSAATAELSGRATSSCTRPLALMLQNGWVAAALGQEACEPRLVPSSYHARPPVPRLGLVSVAARIVWEIRRALPRTSLRREIDWLNSRLRERIGRGGRG